MPVLTDLFGTVVPAQLNTPVQVTLTTEDGSQTVPAVITLRNDETRGYLVAEFLCLSDAGSAPLQSAEMFDDVLRNNLSVVIQFEATDSPSRLTAIVLSYNHSLMVAFGNAVRGKMMVTQQEVRTSSDALDSSRLCIPDFPPFTGPCASTTVETTYSHSPQSRSFQRMGWVELEADDWRITIAQRIEPSALEYSHDVLVTKEGGKQFSADELSKLLGTLSHYLTFIAGVPRWPHHFCGIPKRTPDLGAVQFCPAERLCPGQLVQP